MSFVDSTITLYDLPELKSPIVLTQARYAQSFGICSSWQDVPITSKGKGKAKTADNDGELISTRTLITTLVVGCRKKVLVFVWFNGILGPTRVSYKTVEAK